MKHIQNKNDWFYEFRPQLILGFGALGLFSGLYLPTAYPSLNYFSQACGIVLLVIAVKILDWRKDYRAMAKKFRH